MSQATSFRRDACLPESYRGSRFTNRELATIAVLASLHFAASTAARILGGMLFVVLGPWAVFVDGLGGEGVPSLLLAVAVTLIPRIGTAAATISTVWLLNAITTGTVGASSLLQVSVSIVAHETILLALGVTLGRRRRPSALSEVLRTALAVGAANSAALYVQFFIAVSWYRLHFDPGYVHQVALVTGFGYGTIGAALGTLWGRLLRRTAP